MLSRMIFTSGVTPGCQLPISKTLCIESEVLRAPIVIEHVSADPRYRTHPVLKLYQIESCVSVPIILSNGRYFGSLCALDRNPSKVAEPRILSMFKHFASRSSARNSIGNCCKSRSIARCSMNARRVNCASNSSPF